jgi:hypothetical protein
MHIRTGLTFDLHEQGGDVIVVEWQLAAKQDVHDDAG